MAPLQILMPMGGLGQRFRDAGISTPKPLIPVLGTPMFKKALAAFDAYEGEKRFFFVIRKDTNDEYGLSEELKKILPSAKVFVLDHNTRGSVETCLLAEDSLDPELPLIIMDCDISFESGDYFSKIQDAVDNEAYDGVLLSFTSDSPRYSFAEVDKTTGLVLRTAEKDPISSDALMGAYFFTKAQNFLNAAHDLIERPISASMKEYYVSLVYNIMLQQDSRVGLAKGTLYCFGTPEELAQYEEDYKN